MINLNLIPDDTLFIKDARPIGSGSFYGKGGNLPLGPALHGAIRAALLKTLPTSKAVQGRTRKYGSKDLRDLNLKGPFPANSDGVFFPTPLDLYTVNQKACLMQWCEYSDSAKHSLPSWIQGCLIGTPTKEKTGTWLSELGLTAYIAGINSRSMPPSNLATPAGEFDYLACLTATSAFYTTEHREGINLKNENLFGVEHMRFTPNAYLTCFASTSELERLKTLELVQLGGEARICKVNIGVHHPLAAPKIEGNLVKWSLLSPTVFIGQNSVADLGWIPDFVNPITGDLLLKTVKDRFINGRRRLTLDPTVDKNVAIHGKLVGAVVGRSRPISQWDKLDGKVKSDYLAVPEGSVYYFECEDAEHAKQLVDALHFRTRSSYLGEKGLGLGICAPWVKNS